MVCTSHGYDTYGSISAMRTVAVVLYDGMRIFDYAVTFEVWGIDRSESGVPSFEFRRCSPGRRAVSADAGTRVRASHGLSGLADADLVIVPGGIRSTAPAHPALLRALGTAHEARTPIVGMCGGAFVLARAGLLRGRRATTHWLLAGELEQRFPDVRVVREALFVEDDGIWTSAGTAASIDLCLHLVRTAHGAEVAATIARRMVSMPHRSGDQRQYIHSPVLDLTSGDPLVEVIAWARAHLHQPLTVRRLAARARMSDRTFARQFVRLTGTTPLRWLQHQRIQLAQELLETTTLSVDSIAHRTGFGSTSALRRHFGRALDTTPTAYRRVYGLRSAEEAFVP
jgi:transcriptional regulator GlxA family with amidase domain